MGSFAGAVLDDAREIASGIRLLRIRPVDGMRPWQIGSHIDVQVMVDGRPQQRSFSLVGDHGDGGAYRIAIKQRPEGRGGSRYLWSLQPGAQLLVSDPVNNFPLAYGAPEYLLVAGGIGITPIYGMARALAHKSAKVRLMYAARDAGQLAFMDELKPLLGDRLSLFLDSEERRLSPAQAVTGLDPDAEAYVCGPLSLRQDLSRAWLEAGRPQGRFRFETFASSGQCPDEPFEVRVVNRDIEFTVGRGETLLQALHAHGIDDVLYDCEHGECGLCSVQVIDHSGEIDHRDVFFTDAQKATNQHLCACVSRVHNGRVVIDTTSTIVDAGKLP